MAGLLCYVEWIVLELATIECFDQFHQTLQIKLLGQVLERSMDHHTCAMDLAYENEAG